MLKWQTRVKGAVSSLQFGHFYHSFCNLKDQDQHIQSIKKKISLELDMDGEYNKWREFARWHLR